MDACKPMGGMCDELVYVIEQVIEDNITAVQAVIEIYEDEAVVRTAVEYLVINKSRLTFTLW